MSQNGASNAVIRKLTDREAQIVLSRIAAQNEATRRVDAAAALLAAEKRALGIAEVAVRDVVAAMEPERLHLKLDEQGGSFVLIDTGPAAAVTEAAYRVHELLAEDE